MVPRRVFAAGLVVALTWAVLLLRGFQLQVVSTEHYREQIRVKVKVLDLLKPMAGEIRDREGRVLARDVRTFDLYVTPRRIERNPETLERAATLMGIPLEELATDYFKVLTKIEKLVNREEPRYRSLRRRGEKRYPWPLSRQVPFEVAYEIDLRDELYEGFSVRETLHREYPYGSVGSHVIGYRGRINPREFDRLIDGGYFIPNVGELISDIALRRLKRLGEFDKEMLGRAGVERLYDSEIRGTSGLAFRYRNLETGARSTELLCAPARGTNLNISLDIELQKKVEEIIDNRSYPHIVALVSEVKTGDILVMATKPRFDPNAFIPPVDGPALKAYFTDEEHRPLMNRAISGQYQVGSIFKIVTAWAGLENRRVTADSPIDCRGKMFAREDSFRCWLYRMHGRGHGPVDIRSALEQSCNCYFYELGRRLKLGPIEKSARKLGFGVKTGIGLAGEARGLLPSMSRPRRWTSMDSMALGIGQSTLLVTPVQVLRLMALVAARGEGPRLGLRKGEKRPIERLPLLRYDIDAIHEGLYRVVHSSKGTAYRAGLARYNAAGKTGSAQTGRTRKAHAWFAGYAPHDDPRYAVVVLVEHGESGGAAAAPIAGEIFSLLTQS